MANFLTNLSRRTKAFFLLVAVAIVIGSLIFYEQIALLYVMATLALVLLLTIVAFADLEKVGVDTFVDE